MHIIVAVDMQETFTVMDIQTKVVTPEEAKIQIDSLITTRLEKGYKKVEDSRFRAVFH